MLHTEGHALLRAVGQGKLRLARLLLEGGAYVNEGDAQGETALMAACRARYDDPQNKARMVRYLLEQGADPNIADRLGRTALMHACAGGGGAAVASLLLAHGADPSVRDHAGASALVHALDRGDRETLATLLDACPACRREAGVRAPDRRIQRPDPDRSTASFPTSQHRRPRGPAPVGGESDGWGSSLSQKHSARSSGVWPLFRAEAETEPHGVGGARYSRKSLPRLARVQPPVPGAPQI